jgi:DNA-nicking Smr family endonuclease
VARHTEYTMKKLDLHGLRHEEAKRAVIRFVEDNWNNEQEAQIVTGHSKKMKEVVMNVLDEYKLNWTNQIGGFITTQFE